MKRLYSALALCLGLLIFEAAVLLPASSAKEDVIAGLLKLPAPPPPNPLSRGRGRSRDDVFYDTGTAPKDNASIEDLLDYWAKQNDAYQDLRYNPEPSEKSLDRLINEIEKKPGLLPDYLNVLPQGDKSSEFVKRLFDRESTTGAYDRDARSTIKRWLTYNSTYFSNDLYRAASGVGDTENYVSAHNELLALVRVDFDKAKPLIDRLQTGGSRKASRALAAWALYRHALDTDSVGDIERYRDELKSIVEDKGLGAPMRDLAMDALVSEKEWAGRDDWYMSLLGDETLANMGGFTGLTTLILVSPPNKYVEKMVELLKSDNPVVRAAAIRNLLSRISTKNPEIIKAMLPWLEDRNWAKESNDERRMIIDALRYLQIPESVTGLLKVLDERSARPRFDVNSMANAANTVANAAVAAANSVRAANRPAANSSFGSAAADELFFVYRSSAVSALGTQGDPRAVPALRRVLPEVESYERPSVVEALLKCKGFSVAEQTDALETYLKIADQANALAVPANNGPANMPYYMRDETANQRKGPLSAIEIKGILGSHLAESAEVSDDLAMSVVDRIEVLDGKDRKLAEQLRKVVLHWQNAAVNLMLLRDVKRDRSSVDATLRLLSQRKTLRETQASDVFELRTGTPASIGIAACLLEDAPDYTAILDGENAETKIAMLACARLIRAELPVAKVGEYTKSGDKRLALAAERYLEAEDSPEARSIVLSLHPNEAKIMGATTAFYVDDSQEGQSLHWVDLFNSVHPDKAIELGYGAYVSDAFKETEEKLIKEVKDSADLLGVYTYKGNFVRIYKDRAMFSWDYDRSRYRERELSKFEFDNIKSYLTENRVDELAPFLECPERNFCVPQELLMLGKNGGRRVFVSSDTAPPFFADLDKIFADLKAVPGVVRYEMSKEIPGLEILLADDDLHVETVWKEGDELRAAVSDEIVRKKVEEEIEKVVEETPEIPESEDEPPVYDPGGDLRTKLTERRRFDSFSWRKIINGSDAGPAQQPQNVELIPLLDTHSVRPARDQWKARTPHIEIRADAYGIYKVVRGKLTRMHQGYYSDPVVTPTGRWVVAYRFTPDEGASIVRINLLTNKVFPVEVQEYSTYLPIAFVPTVNKVLIVEQNDNHGEEEEYDDSSEMSDTVAADPAASEMLLLDPETGRTQPASGEFRPVTHQTYRQLQKTAKPNEYWAAIPDREKNETQIGIYDTKVFGFRPVMRIPKMTFNSMSMFVDEPGKWVYFVYRGHLLRLPLAKI